MSGEPLLELDRVSVRYAVREGWLRKPRTLTALRDVSLSISPGEALGIVGESGCGKSTLARAVLQLVRPTNGRVAWLGSPLEHLSLRELRPLRRDMQIVFQDPLASLDPLMTIGETVAEPLRVHRPELDRRGRARLVGAMLERVGLTRDMGMRYPHEFSGGQCQRVGLARAMILEPRLLVCDEAVSALDVSIQAQIVNLLQRFKRELGIAILFVSHNLAVVRHICDRVLVLYLGSMMECAPTAELFRRPLHPYTKALLAAVPIPDPEVQPARLAGVPAGELPSPLALPSGCPYRTRCLDVRARCAEAVPSWKVAAGSGHALACHVHQDELR